MLAAPATATARTLAHIFEFLLAASWISSGGPLMAALIHINLRVRTALITPVLRSPPNSFMGFSLIDPFTTAILFGAVLSIATWPIRSGPDPSGLGRGSAATLLLLLSIVAVVLPMLVLAPNLADH